MLEQQSRFMTGIHSIQVANSFIHKAAQHNKVLDSFFLNWLVVMSQGHHLAQENEPLFDCSIIAGRTGPFVPAVQKAARKYLGAPMQKLDISHSPRPQLPQEKEQFVEHLAPRLFASLPGGASDPLIRYDSTWFAISQKANHDSAHAHEITWHDLLNDFRKHKVQAGQKISGNSHCSAASLPGDHVWPHLA